MSGGFLDLVQIQSDATTYAASFRTLIGVDTLSSGTIATALGYTPANDATVMKLTGDQTAAGTKTLSGKVVLTFPSSANLDVDKQFVLSNAGAEKIIIGHDTGRSRIRMTSPNGSVVTTLDQTNSGLQATSDAGWAFYYATGSSGFFNQTTGFEAIQNGSSFYLRGGGDAVRLYTVAVAAQTADIQQWVDSSYVVLASVSANGSGLFKDLTIRPSASRTPAANGDLVFEATSNTTLTFKFKGSDGTVRSGTITLA